MAQIMVPTDQAEAPVGDGVDTPFPKGQWQGEICGIHMGDLPPWVGTEGAGYVAENPEDGVVLSIELGNNKSLDGQDSFGYDRKHFVPFVIKDGDETLETIDVSDRKSKSWQLQRSARLITNLAMALGETEELETEEGVMMTVVAEDFLDNLKSGVFNGGTEIAFTTTHKNYKSREGEAKVEVITKEFFQAV